MHTRFNLLKGFDFVPSWMLGFTLLTDLSATLQLVDRFWVFLGWTLLADRLWGSPQVAILLYFADRNWMKLNATLALADILWVLLKLARVPSTCWQTLNIFEYFPRWTLRFNLLINWNSMLPSLNVVDGFPKVGWLTILLPRPVGDGNHTTYKAMLMTGAWFMALFSPHPNFFSPKNWKFTPWK